MIVVRSFFATLQQPAAIHFFCSEIIKFCITKGAKLNLVKARIETQGIFFLQKCINNFCICHQRLLEKKVEIQKVKFSFERLNT